MQRTIPTEPIGSIPRPHSLIKGYQSLQQGQITSSDMEQLFDDAVTDTIRRFEQTGSPIITDGEQRKHSFVTYPLFGLKNLDPNGAVISVSALSLLYPMNGVAGYSKEEFIKDILNEGEKDIRQCLNQGVSVQIDFTEGRLALKLDPSKSLLKAFIDLNNQVLSRFTDAEKARIGVHTCPGGDHDSTHSADVPYADFLPELFQINAGNFFVQLSSEPDRKKALSIMRPFAKGQRRIFVGVTDPISKNIETNLQVRDRILEAADFISPEYLGTTDDCGFSPFCDDVSTSRDIAFAKITARVAGTALAAQKLGL